MGTSTLQQLQSALLSVSGVLCHLPISADMDIWRDPTSGCLVPDCSSAVVVRCQVLHTS
jgi:hypothetical protein